MENFGRCPSCMTPTRPDMAFCMECGARLDVSNDLNQLPVGTLLAGRYRLGRCIGAGGFGITYIGWDEKLGMTVAVKEYYPSGMTNRYSTISLDVTAESADRTADFEKEKKRFIDEAHTLAQFAEEPHIVCVRDFFSENNTEYIVMEFLRGKSLKQLLDEEGPMPFDRAAELLLPVMDALNRVHKKGLIHRDISPSNLMMTADGRVKLLDFGTARCFDTGDERSLSVILKPGFAPEEQYRSRSDQGPWSDVYAFCATIYKMITGITPENAMNRLFEDTLKKPSACGAKITAAQEQALLKGMAVRAGDRYASMEQLRDAIVHADEVPVYTPAAAAEGEERTLYCPVPGYTHPAPSQPAPQPVPRQSAPQQPASRPAHAESQPRASAPVPPERKPDPPRKKAAPAAEAAQAAPRHKKRGHHAHKEKAGRKNLGFLKYIFIGAAVVAAVITGAMFMMKNPYVVKENPKNSYAHGEEITVAGIRRLNRDRKNESVTFIKCRISDEVLEELGKNKRIKEIQLDTCTGFSGIDPLAKIPTLEKLRLAGESAGSKDGFQSLDSLISTPFPTVKWLEMRRFETKDGGKALQYFPGLLNLYVEELRGELSLEYIKNSGSLQWLALDTLVVRNQDFSVLANLSRLDSVQMKALGMRDVSWAEKISTLKYLTLSSNQITSLAPLKNCKNLVSIYVSNNKLTSLQGLENCSRLESVSADNNQLTDISALKNCDLLRNVTLKGNQLASADALDNCKKLMDLNLSGNRISDLSWISSCPSLKLVVLTGNPISSLKPLGSCTKVEKLYADQMNLSNLQGCESLQYLKILNADNNRISDISALGNCTVLESVRLRNNQISDLSPLKRSAPVMQSLMVTNNRITSLDGLRGSTALRILCAENNQLQDLQPISGNTQLLALMVSHNQISAVGALQGMEDLAVVDLADNRITSLSAMGAYEHDARILLLENNQLGNISSLSEDVRYLVLSLNGNPVRSWSDAEKLNKKGSNKEKIFLSADQNADLNPVFRSNYHQYNLVNAPVSAQKDLKKACEEAKKAVKDNNYYRFSFLEEAQAEQELEKIRGSLRSKLEAAAATLSFGNFLLGY